MKNRLNLPQDLLHLIEKREKADRREKQRRAADSEDVTTKSQAGVNGQDADAMPTLEHHDTSSAEDDRRSGKDRRTDKRRETD